MKLYLSVVKSVCDKLGLFSFQAFPSFIHSRDVHMSHKINSRHFQDTSK